MSSHINIRQLLIIASLFLFQTLNPGAGFSFFSPDPEVWISPVSLTANEPGLELSEAFIELLVVRSELTYPELEKLGIRPGMLPESAVRTLLESLSDFNTSRYIRFFDATFGETSDLSLPNNVWQRISEFDSFISDAIVLGDLDEKKEGLLRRSLEIAGKGEGTTEIFSARSQAFRLLLDARTNASRKARAYRKLSQALDLELSKRVFEQSIGMVVDIRTKAKRSTISPVSLVRIQCNDKEKPSLNLIFRERKRECDELGTCRVESISTLRDNQDALHLFNRLRESGRNYLDQCTMTTKMLIDGSEVEKMLPGKFTSLYYGERRQASY